MFLSFVSSIEMDKKLYELIEACGYGLLEPAQKLISDGVNVNGFQNNFTPLIASICGQNIEVVELLINSGANINQENYTALHEAFDSILANMVNENVNEPDWDDLKIIELLINNGGDIEKEDETGKTPLEALNNYAANEETFEKMKSFFRSIIPDIDQRIEFNLSDNG